MCDQDIELRRKRDLERYHRQAAERRAKGLCLKCGKRPPAPHRSQCEPCAEKRRAADLERYHRRTAGRIAQGLCPKCGKRPPAPERSQCEPCLEKDAAAGRARDARLRAAGISRRDPEKTRAYERNRARRQIEARRAEGLCIACGKSPALPGRASCEPCLEKRRAWDRAKYAAGKAAGKPYGGADPEAKRRASRARHKRLSKAWREAGLCVRCGKSPAADGGEICAPCQEKRRAKDRRKYAERRAAGLCTSCGAPALEGQAYCGPCAFLRTDGRSSELRNAAARRKYAERRAQGLCTDCGAPSQGAARCEACARRSYERSTYFRGIPLYPPQYTVVALETGEDLGTWDSWEDVALCLAFSRLSLDQVTVITDQSPAAAWAAWE